MTLDEDTAEKDTSEEDTSEEDTSKEDTSEEDTSEEDTAEEDTPEEDTSEEDTPEEETPEAATDRIYKSSNNYWPTKKNNYVAGLFKDRFYPAEVLSVAGDKASITFIVLFKVLDLAS